MASSDADSEHIRANPCKEGTPTQIVYAWARDAPKLLLPDGVGFKVGKSSSIKYLVLQVHYAHVDKFKGLLNIFIFIRQIFTFTLTPTTKIHFPKFIFI